MKKLFLNPTDIPSQPESVTNPPQVQPRAHASENTTAASVKTLSDSSGWNGPLNSLKVKLPLLLAVKPCKNLRTRSLSRRQNEMTAMPSKIIVMLSTNATVFSCRAKTLAPNWKSYSSIQQTLRANLSPWQMLHKFSRGHMQLKIPLLLQLKPWKILLSRSLSRHHNKMVVMPSKIIVMLSTNATEVSSQMKILRPHYSDILIHLF